MKSPDNMCLSTLRPMRGKSYSGGQVLGNEATDEYKVGAPCAQCGPKREEWSLGKSSVVRVVLGVGFVFHGRQKRSHSRNADAASGPRRPVLWGSR